MARSMRTHIGWGGTIGVAILVAVVAGLVTPARGAAQSAAINNDDEVTFTKDIAPILQRSCQNCHQPDSVAPMSLITYEDVRPYARAIKMRTHLGPVAGVMPPWYIEKDVGIQHYQFDPSLTDEELDTIARWVDNRAPRGDPADMPPPRPIGGTSVWTAGEPDLITVTEDVLVKGDAADWWGEVASVPIGTTEDRYVASVEIREINDVLDADGTPGGRETVGGRFVIHHMIWSTRVVDEDGEVDESTSWPVHEVGRNADVFDPEGARLLPANSRLVTNSVHLHSNGRDTKAHLEIGWRFHPEGYEPRYERARRSLGNAVDIDIKAMEKDQELHAYYVLPEHTKITTFEPHLHAPGARMCLEAIWGINIQTLTCAATTTTGCGATSTPRATSRCCPKAPSCTSSATWTTRRGTGTSPTRGTGRDRVTGRWPTCSSTWDMASP